MIMKTLSSTITALTLTTTFVSSAHAGFEWTDTNGKHTDLSLDGKKIARYVYEAIDTSSAERRTATYKPFHHVFGSDGETLITKGPGGQFTHHRGIYYGFSKCSYTDTSGKTHRVDTWHCKGDTHQAHLEVLDQTADADSATQKVSIAWNGDGGKTFATEQRQLTFSTHGDGLVVDFRSTLSTDLDTVKVDGDPQHAGFQFRASNEVSASTKKQTVYTRPGTGAASPGATKNFPQAKDMVDLPWKAMSFTVGGKRYTTIYIDSEKNPKPGMYSERDYGRFGSYFVAELTPAKPLDIHYKLYITPGDLTPDQIQKIVAGLK